jgi:hypothetical protein
MTSTHTTNTWQTFSHSKLTIPLLFKLLRVKAVAGISWIPATGVTVLCLCCMDQQIHPACQQPVDSHGGELDDPTNRCLTQ